MGHTATGHSALWDIQLPDIQLNVQELNVCLPSVCPSGTRLGHKHVLRYILVLDMFCQQILGCCSFRGVYILLDTFCQTQGGEIYILGFYILGNIYKLSTFAINGYIMPTLGG